MVVDDLVVLGAGAPAEDGAEVPGALVGALVPREVVVPGVEMLVVDRLAVLVAREPPLAQLPTLFGVNMKNWVVRLLVQPCWATTDWISVWIWASLRHFEGPPHD